jgi:hypothetical protein
MEKFHSHIDHILIGRRRHSSIIYVQLFRTADCGTDHYLVMAKVRERPAVKDHTDFMWKGSISRILMR